MPAFHTWAPPGHGTPQDVTNTTCAIVITPPILLDTVIPSEVLIVDPAVRPRQLSRNRYTASVLPVPTPPILLHLVTSE